MIYLLLCIIIAILLFGSSAVIGFAGIVLGAIAAIFALCFAVDLFGEKVILVSFFLVLGFALWGAMSEPAQAKRPR